MAEAIEVAALYDNKKIADDYPFLEGVTPVHGKDNVKTYMARVWEPTLTVTGIDGLPEVAKAGNVLNPSLTMRLSIRIPPTLDHDAAKDFVIKELERDPPYGAKVKVVNSMHGSGFDSPEMSQKLETIVENASQNFFGHKAKYFGEGGSIPLMNHLKKIHPKAQWLVLGVLGPQSNCHGPNEFIHLPSQRNL